MKKILIGLTLLVPILSLASNTSSSTCHDWIDEVSDTSRKVSELGMYINKEHRFMNRVKLGQLLEEDYDVAKEERHLNSLRKDLVGLKTQLNDVVSTAKETCK